MGIKFNCPNGHKLNVKSFLAGKKGVCPHCGASFRIPSDQAADGDDGDETATEPALPAPMHAAASKSNGATAVPVAPVAAGQIAPATVTATVRPATPVPAAVAVPVRPAEVPGPAVPYGAIPQGGVPHPIAVPTTGMPPTATPVKVMPAAAVPAAVAVPIAPGRPLVSPGTIDPIAEAPMAAWYVRPPSGGQYGPARGDVMRKWIGEGRVSSDSLVWREGWQDWRGASQLFPSLGLAAGDTTGGAMPEAPIPKVAPRSSTRTMPRRRGNGLAIAGVIFLALLCVGLVVALVFVLGGVQ